MIEKWFFGSRVGNGRQWAAQEKFGVVDLAESRFTASDLAAKVAAALEGGADRFVVGPIELLEARGAKSQTMELLQLLEESERTCWVWSSVSPDKLGVSMAALSSHRSQSPSDIEVTKQHEGVPEEPLESWIPRLGIWFHGFNDIAVGDGDGHQLDESRTTVAELLERVGIAGGRPELKAFEPVAAQTLKGRSLRRVLQRAARGEDLSDETVGGEDAALSWVGTFVQQHDETKEKLDELLSKRWVARRRAFGALLAVGAIVISATAVVVTLGKNRLLEQQKEVQTSRELVVANLTSQEVLAKQSVDALTLAGEEQEKQDGDFRETIDRMEKERQSLALQAQYLDKKDKNREEQERLLEQEKELRDAIRSFRTLLKKSEARKEALAKELKEAKANLEIEERNRKLAEGASARRVTDLKALTELAEERKSELTNQAAAHQAVLKELRAQLATAREQNNGLLAFQRSLEEKLEQCRGTEIPAATAGR